MIDKVDFGWTVACCGKSHDSACMPVFLLKRYRVKMAHVNTPEEDHYDRSVFYASKELH